jgi:hypothetical protein
VKNAMTGAASLSAVVAVWWKCAPFWPISSVWMSKAGQQPALQDPRLGGNRTVLRSIVGFSLAVCRLLDGVLLALLTLARLLG